jgi:hypothetical protein
MYIYLFLLLDVNNQRKSLAGYKGCSVWALLHWSVARLRGIGYLPATHNLGSDSNLLVLTHSLYCLFPTVFQVSEFPTSNGRIQARSLF